MPEPTPRPTAEQLARYAELFNASLSLNHFGVRLSFPDTETVRVDLSPVRPEHRGGLGTDAVNGGVLAASSTSPSAALRRSWTPPAATPPSSSR
ncbi:MAG: hypothetical protein ACYC8T_39000 [Myxococcaceae bacterium]